MPLLFKSTMIKDGFSSTPSVFFRDVFVGLYELDLHVDLAGNFLDLCHKEKVIDKGKDFRRSIHALGKRLHIGGGLSAIVEPRSLHAVAIALIAIAVVHGANKTRSATPLSATAIVTVVAVLSTLPALVAGSILAVLAVLALIL
jgi:hypothetical protein